MFKTIYGIYDAKNASYVNFIITDNEVNLMRDLKYVVNSGDSNNYLSICSSDFSLCKLAEIDDEKGEVKQIRKFIVTELAALKEIVSNGERTTKDL